jgi:hypothetical protein
MTTSRAHGRLLHLSLVSVVSGALTALGLLVLLQQAGTVYPTRTVTIVGLLLGLVWGIAVPSVARSVGAHRSVR